MEVPIGRSLLKRLLFLCSAFAVPIELRRQVVVTAAIRIYSAAMQLAVVVLTARALGPEGRGVIAAAWSWVTLFALFAALCLGQAAAGVASRGDQKDWLGATLATLCVAGAVATTLGWLCAFSLWVLSDGTAFGGLTPTTLVVTFVALPILIWGQYQPYLLTAAGRLDLANRANLIGRSATPLTALIALYVLDWGAEGALLAMTVGEAIIALTGTGALFNQARSAIVFVSRRAGRLLKDGLTLLPSTLGWFLISSTQILVVYALRGDAETGIFQLGVFAIDALALIGGSSALVVYERVAKTGADESWGEVRRLVATLIGVTALFAFVSVPIVLWAFPIAFGARFDAATAVFLGLLPTLLGRLLSALMTPQWIARGYLWQLSALYLLIGVLNVLLTVLGVDAMGSTGAVLAANASFALVAACHVGLAVRIESRIRLASAKCAVR